MARVSARPRPSPPRVYLIAAAGAPKSPAWPKVMRAVRAKLPGAEVLHYHQFFPSGDRGADDRVARIAAELSGALVIAHRWTDRETGAVRYLLGDAARREAEGLAALGVPVLVLAPAGIVAWPDVRARPAEGAPPRLPVEVDMPAPPPGTLLPTAAASYRALGIAPPAPRKPRAAPRPAPSPAAELARNLVRRPGAPAPSGNSGPGAVARRPGRST